MAHQANEVDVTREVLKSAMLEHRPEALGRALRSLAPGDAVRVLDGYHLPTSPPW